MSTQENFGSYFPPDVNGFTPPIGSDRPFDARTLLLILLREHGVQYRAVENSQECAEPALRVYADASTLAKICRGMSDSGCPPVQRIDRGEGQLRVYFAPSVDSEIRFLAVDIVPINGYGKPHGKLAGAYRRIAKHFQAWKTPAGVQVVLLGPDGAGKSTVGAAVAQALKPLFNGSEVLQWRPQVIKPRPPQDPNTVEPPHTRPVYGTLRSLVHLLAVVFDYWVGNVVRVKPLLADGKLILFDRDFHDILVDPVRYRYGGPRWVLRFLLKLVPQPERFMLVLDADAEVILGRKREVTPQELRRQLVGYRDLASRTPDSFLVRTDRAAEVSQREVCEAVLRFLSKRFAERYASGSSLQEVQRLGPSGGPSQANQLDAEDLISRHSSRPQPGAAGLMGRFSRMWPDWKSLMAKGTVAVLDQGLISGSNFVLSVLLARWLGAADYGAYALAFAIFVLFSLLHQALILEPMSVFGPSTYRTSLGTYLGILLWLQSGIAGLVFLLGAGAGIVYSHWGLGPLQLALLGMTFASPCVLLFWYARRAFYLELLPTGALRGSIAYCVLLLISIFVLVRTKWLSPLTAFGVMGISALLTSVLLLNRVRVAVKTSIEFSSAREVALEHWRYGRWALAASLFFWIPWNVYYTFVAAFSGLAEAGTLRALMNFAAPISQTFAAFSLLFLPYTSRVGLREGWPSVKAQAVRVAVLFAAGAAVYWLLIAFFSDRVIRFLYAGHYAVVVPLIPWVALASILTGVSLGPTIALRAMHRPEAVCAVFFLSSVVALAVGVPAVWAWGARGAVMAILLSSVTAAAGAFWMLRYQERREAVQTVRLENLPAESEGVRGF